ncbi:hypothetical protein Dimus_016291 [Dionaea muscipula]
MSWVLVDSIVDWAKKFVFCKWSLNWPISTVTKEPHKKPEGVDLSISEAERVVLKEVFGKDVEAPMYYEVCSVEKLLKHGISTVPPLHEEPVLKATDVVASRDSRFDEILANPSSPRM